MECELCGRQTDERYIASIENVELRICARCAKGKHVTAEESQSSRPRQQLYKTAPTEEYEMVEDYGSRIRRAREQMKIPVKVLAEMLNEKEGVITRVEQQKMTPPEPLRKKLEKALGVKLAESTPIESQQVHGRGNSEGATLGEFVD